MQRLCHVGALVKHPKLRMFQYCIVNHLDWMTLRSVRVKQLYCKGVAMEWHLLDKLRDVQ